MTGGVELKLAREAEAQTVRLTDRWTPLVPHEMQSLYMWHPARFKVVPAGRRSGKTELAKRKGVLRLIRQSDRPQKIFYAAPTHGQAKDIFWNDLQQLIPQWWVANVNNTDLEITTHWGATIRVFGFDRPRRIEGVPWDHGFIDEGADCPKDNFKLHVRPALSTKGRKGSCDLIGVPDEIGRNQAEYEMLWDMGTRWAPELAGMPQEKLIDLKADPEICSFWWPSKDILDAEEIEAMRRQMDRFSFTQEMEGRFTRSGGKAAPDFDRKYHVKEWFTLYDPRLPLDFSVDFGSANAAALIGQTWGDYTWILHTYPVRNGSSRVAAEEFLDIARRNNYSLNRVRVFGDPAGRTPSSPTGQSDYQEIAEVLAANVGDIDWMQLRETFSLKDTLNTVRGKLLTVSREIKLHIHPRCESLITDLNDAPWPSDLKEFHSLATLRYYLFKLYGILGPRYASGPMRGLPGFGRREGGGHNQSGPGLTTRERNYGR